MIELVKQRTDKECCVAAAVMLTGEPYDKVLEAAKRIGGNNNGRSGYPLLCVLSQLVAPDNFFEHFDWFQYPMCFPCAIAYRPKGPGSMHGAVLDIDENGSIQILDPWDDPNWNPTLKQVYNELVECIWYKRPNAHVHYDKNKNCLQ